MRRWRNRWRRSPARWSKAVWTRERGSACSWRSASSRSSPCSGPPPPAPPSYRSTRCYGRARWPTSCATAALSFWSPRRRGWPACCRCSRTAPTCGPSSWSMPLTAKRDRRPAPDRRSSTGATGWLAAPGRRAARTAESTPTWWPSSTPPAAPGCRRASCCPTATWLRVRAASRSTWATTPKTGCSRPCRSASMRASAS